MKTHYPVDAANRSTVRVVINADDLGHANGINRGIEDCHRNGMIDECQLDGEIDLRLRTGSKWHFATLRLSVGLHLNVTDEDPESVDLGNVAWVDRELHYQYDKFIELLGRPPTHLDSHHHIHRQGSIADLFRWFAIERNVPLRHFSSIQFEGSFYGQWVHGVTDLQHVRPQYLCGLLRSFSAGLYEVSCHPGYVTPDFESIYSLEREEEVRTLTSTTVRLEVETLGIELLGFDQCSIPQA